MHQLEIAIPDDLATYMDAEVASGRFSDAADLIRHILRDRQERQDNLSRLIQEAEDSGPSGMTFDEIIQEAREEYESRGA